MTSEAPLPPGMTEADLLRSVLRQVLNAASPLCSCGAQAVEDGGTEGRCECCTGCERDAPLTDEERRRLLTPPEVTP